MIAGQFVLYGKESSKLCRETGKTDEADEAQVHVDNMIEAVKTQGWDGGWYLRAYDYYGNKVGSKDNEEGKIFIESQGFCGMAGIVNEEGMVEKSMYLVKEWFDNAYGIVVRQEGFTKYYIEH